MEKPVGKFPHKPARPDRTFLCKDSVVDGVGFIVLLIGILGPVMHGLLFLGSSVLHKSSSRSEIIGKDRSRPGVLRGWHIANATTVVFLAATGLALRLGLPAGSGDMATWHSIAGGWHVITWALWFGYNLISGCYVVHYLPADGWCVGMMRQILYYGWGIFLGRPHPHPHGGFNPLQSVVYLLVMGLLLPLVMISGVGVLSLRSVVFGNIDWWRHLLVQTHFLAGCLLLGFLSVHLYLAVWGPEGRLWRR